MILSYIFGRKMKNIKYFNSNLIVRWVYKITSDAFVSATFDGNWLLEVDFAMESLLDSSINLLLK